MRQAGIIPDAEQARLFADYLLSLGITSQVDRADFGWAVWIHDDAQLEQCRLELNEFLSEPQADRYRSAQAKAEAVRREQAQAQQRYNRNVVDVRRRWRPWTEGRFPLTWVLIGLSVGLSLGTDFGHSVWASQWLFIVPFYDGGTTWAPLLGLQSIRQGEVWRLFTPAFLQVGGWWHLIGNVYWLYMFGALVETRRGRLTLLGVVLATGIFSNLIQYGWDGPSFGGMSGVGFGLFGYIWMKSRFDAGAGIYCPPDVVVMFLFWLVLCMTGRIGPIANAAHAGGLAVGLAIGYAPSLWRKLR